jgi:hypothetical protein
MAHNVEPLARPLRTRCMNSPVPLVRPASRWAWTQPYGSRPVWLRRSHMVLCINNLLRLAARLKSSKGCRETASSAKLGEISRRIRAGKWLPNAPIFAGFANDAMSDNDFASDNGENGVPSTPAEIAQVPRVDTEHPQHLRNSISGITKAHLGGCAPDHRARLRWFQLSCGRCMSEARCEAAAATPLDGFGRQ